MVGLYCVSSTGITFPRNPFLATSELGGHKRPFAWDLKGRKGTIFFLCLQGQSRGIRCFGYSWTLSFIFWLMVLAGHAAKPAPPSALWILLQFLTAGLCANSYGCLPLWWRVPASPEGRCIITVGSLEAVRDQPFWWIPVGSIHIHLPYPTGCPAYFRIQSQTQSEQLHRPLKQIS